MSIHPRRHWPRQIKVLVGLIKKLGGNQGMLSRKEECVAEANEGTRGREGKGAREGKREREGAKAKEGEGMRVKGGNKGCVDLIIKYCHLACQGHSQTRN